MVKVLHRPFLYDGKLWPKGSRLPKGAEAPTSMVEKLDESEQEFEDDPITEAKIKITAAKAKVKVKAE